MANFCHQKNHSFGGGKVSSHILDNEFLEAAKQIWVSHGAKLHGCHVAMMLTKFRTSFFVCRVNPKPGIRALQGRAKHRVQIW